MTARFWRVFGLLWCLHPGAAMGASTWHLNGIDVIPTLEELRCPALFRTEVVFANLIRGEFQRVPFDWQAGPVVEGHPTVLSHWLRPHGPWPKDIWVHHHSGGACVAPD